MYGTIYDNPRDTTGSGRSPFDDDEPDFFDDEEDEDIFLDIPDAAEIREQLAEFKKLK